MRAVVQRVASASVAVDAIVIGKIDRGLLVFVGMGDDDTGADAEWLAGKLATLRIFADEPGRMNRSVAEIDGEILAVSQFTLHASTRKGTRPSFNRAAPPEAARPLYDQFVAALSSALGRTVATGEFGADMRIALINDGPVTLVLDSKTRE